MSAVAPATSTEAKRLLSHVAALQKLPCNSLQACLTASLTAVATQPSRSLVRWMLCTAAPITLPPTASSAANIPSRRPGAATSATVSHAAAPRGHIHGAKRPPRSPCGFTAAIAPSRPFPPRTSSAATRPGKSCSPPFCGRGLVHERDASLRPTCDLVCGGGLRFRSPSPRSLVHDDLKRAPPLLLPAMASSTAVHRTVLRRGFIRGGDVPPRPFRGLVRGGGPPLPLPPGSLVQGDTTAVRVDFSAEAMIPTAVSWPCQHQQAALYFSTPSSVATSPKDVRADGDDSCGHLVAASAAAGRAPPPPPPRGEPR